MRTLVLIAETACLLEEVPSSVGETQGWVMDRQDTTLSAAILRVVDRDLQVCKDTTKASDSHPNPGTARPSRCCKRSVAWQRRGSVSCATTIRSSSTTEVSRLCLLRSALLVLTFPEDPSGVKTDRAMSPNTMSEEDRRELIARQHRALYGDNASLYNADGNAPRRGSQDVRAPSGPRGGSPLAFDPFVQAQAGAEGAVQMPPRDRQESTASPASNQAAQQSFGLMSEAQQSSRASNSSPGASPPLVQGQKGGVATGVAPIGTRPVQGAPSQAPGLNKRSTTPLTPSSLSYGFSSSDAQNSAAAQPKDERSTSAASNPTLADKTVPGLGGAWASNSGVWGKNTLGAQASVWG